jgi:hypothetical protein
MHFFTGFTCFFSKQKNWSSHRRSNHPKIKPSKDECPKFEKFRQQKGLRSLAYFRLEERDRERETHTHTQIERGEQRKHRKLGDGRRSRAQSKSDEKNAALFVDSLPLCTFLWIPF